MLSGGLARAALGMMTGWARQLRPASFRGVPFYVEGYGATYGRRGPDHEYPGRDTPYAEDLGRQKRSYQFTGYVIGDDYPARRDRLVRACEQEGAGELVHPTVGTVQVVCRSCRMSEERERGRYCAFEFAFVEAGQLREPTDSTDPDSAVEGAAAGVTEPAQTSFLSNFSTAGGGSFLSGSSIGDIQDFARTLQQLRLPAPTLPQGALGQSLGNLNNNAAHLAANPPMLASGVDSAFAGFTDAGEAARVVPAMLRFISPPQQQIATDYPTPWPGTRAAHTGVSLPYVIRRANNKVAFDHFTHRLALREIGYAVPGLDLDNYDQAMALQREISIAFALIEEQAAEAGDDEVFLALVGLRAAIMRMISSRAVHLNPLVTYRVVSETPANALTLAWRLYQDSGGRDLEIVARVAARNPAFLPMTGRVLAA